MADSFVACRRTRTRSGQPGNCGRRAWVLARLPGLDHLVGQGLYRGGLGENAGTPRGTLGWDELPHEVDLPDAPVTGALPDWLSGTLLLTGPGKWDLGGQDLEHWWDGLALLQRFSFGSGRVLSASS
jgi:hypothetical protein